MMYWSEMGIKLNDCWCVCVQCELFFDFGEMLVFYEVVGFDVFCVFYVEIYFVYFFICVVNVVVRVCDDMFLCYYICVK